MPRGGGLSSELVQYLRWLDVEMISWREPCGNSLIKIGKSCHEAEEGTKMQEISRAEPNLQRSPGNFLLNVDRLDSGLYVFNVIDRSIDFGVINLRTASRESLPNGTKLKMLICKTQSTAPVGVALVSPGVCMAMHEKQISRHGLCCLIPNAGQRWMPE